ncbi:Scr1 family TA system antitoxin-like transcriptional regulator [Streptomyces sp. NPDC003860]
MTVSSLNRPPDQPAAHLVLGTWLRHLRTTAGRDLRHTAGHLQMTPQSLLQMENGQLTEHRALAAARLYGCTPEQQQTIATLAEQREHACLDTLPERRERLTAIEARAESLTTWSLATAALHPWTQQPWPPEPVTLTLVVEDLVLHQPHGGSAATAARLTELADRVEASDSRTTVRVISYTSPEVQGLAGMGASSSVATWGRGHLLTVSAGVFPFYRSGEPARVLHNAVVAVEKAALGVEESVRALRAAATRHEARAHGASSE